jgi:SNF2 family DNA or RNA helicase
MIKTSPKPHQIEGAKFIVTKKTGIVGAKTGKGKTLIILASIHRHVFGIRDYAVVFAPVKAYDNVWAQEIEKHSDMKYIRLPKVLEKWKATQSLAFLDDYDIILVKYPDVKDDFFEILNLIIPGRVCVMDECHKLKTPDTKLVRLLSNLTREAKAKWGMTATAIGNSILDLWGIMHFLDARVLGTEQEFKRNYCVMEEKVIGWTVRFGRKVQDTRLEVVDYKNLDHLKEIMSEYMWTIPSDLKVSFHEIRYTQTEYEENIYLKAAQGLLEKDSMKGFAQRMPDLQRVADGAYDVDRNKTTGYRSSKYEEYIKEIKSKLVFNQSCIMFAEFNDTFDMLHSLLSEDLKGVPIYKISGSSFEYNPETVKLPCLILSTIAGTESLNLKFANHVFCYSLPFSVFGFIQLVGRITRMDSEFLDDLNVYLPMCDTNIDAYKYNYLMTNAALINTVLGTDANLPVKTLDDQRRSMLSELRKELLWRTKAVKKNKTLK